MASVHDIRHVELPAAGSAEAMVLWEALQQYIDNTLDVAEDELGGEAARVAMSKMETAQRLVDCLAARFVAGAGVEGGRA